MALDEPRQDDNIIERGAYKLVLDPQVAGRLQQGLTLPQPVPRIGQLPQDLQVLASLLLHRLPDAVLEEEAEPQEETETIQGTRRLCPREPEADDNQRRRPVGHHLRDQVLEFPDRWCLPP